jgi:hypothetical protein
VREVPGPGLRCPSPKKLQANATKAALACCSPQNKVQTCTYFTRISSGIFLNSHFDSRHAETSITSVCRHAPNRPSRNFQDPSLCALLSQHTLARADVVNFEEVCAKW